MRVNLFRKHVTKYLSAYCQGELTEAAAEQMKVHLARCERCQKEYTEIQVGIKLAAQLQVGLAPTSLWSGVSEKLAVSPPRPWAIWKYAMAATALVFVVLSGWLVVNRNQREQVVQRENREPASAQPSVLPSPAEKQHPLPTPARQADRAVQAGLAWEVVSLTGAPRIGAAKIKDRGKLRIGEWLETDNVSSAKIKIAEIGYVDIDPNSRVRLVQTKNTEHRVALAQGKLSALILAPPRLFIVDTPSATAVDLGCAYTLEVDEFGSSLLHVTSGWVSLVRDGRESFVPAGAMCATRKGIGIGTPYFADATGEFKAAQNSHDFDKGATVLRAIGSLLAAARTPDALTLWHLLGRRYKDQTAEIRGRIYDRLIELAPPPATVTRTGILNGNRKMLDLWWEEKIR